MTTKAYATGNVIDYANTGSAISSGDVVTTEEFVGIAITDIAATSGTGAVAIEGVFSVTKAAGATWSIGEKVYWDSGSSNFTTTASGNQFAGFAFVAATSGATTGYLKLHPSDLDAMDVLTTQGDIITADSNGDMQRLAIGAANKYLTSDGTDVAWSTYTLALGGNFATAGAWTHSGAHAVTITTTGTTGVTLPTSGSILSVAADGTAGQVLQTNGSAVYSFASATYAEKTATIDISKAQLLALNGGTGGDLEVVAAQAGVIYVPTCIQVFCDYDTAEYTGGDDCVLVLGTVASGTVVANIDKTAFIPGTTADAHFFMSMPDTALWASSATTKGIAITSLANTALSFNVKSGGSQFTDPGTAAGVFKLKVYYREIALLS